jgi:hypothetical protein
MELVQDIASDAAPTDRPSGLDAHPNAPAKPGETGRHFSPTQVAVMVAVIGITITAAVSWTAWTLNRNNEHRLLEVQTKQAGAVVAASILSIHDPLSAVQEIATATGGDVQQFRTHLSPYVGPGLTFATASLWQVTGTDPHLIETVGSAPELAPTSTRTRALVTLATHSKSFVVTGILSGASPRVGYAVGSPGASPYVVYAERAIPADRVSPVESNPAFSNLDYATYIGSVSPAGLATTDVALSHLPLAGAAKEVIPFGDTTLTLVAVAEGPLGGSLGGDLPWIFLVGGALLTVATAVTAEQLVRRRRDAEEDAGTITELYDRLDSLYGEQRSIAEALQRALLPQFNPSIPNLEVASRYMAGADGVDIGGDWYSLIPVDEGHFAFAVGDVSGRGVRAATVMARLRFTIRAYLREGHPPDRVLEMCSGEIDVIADDHFSTVLVGVGDLETRRITIANAGHLNPLLVSGSHSEFITTTVGLPLGVRRSTYRPTTFVMPPSSMLMAFTDGLVERRTEGLDTGLQRLAAAASAAAPSLDDLLTDVVSELAHGSEDDIAVLAFRWRSRVAAEGQGISSRPRSDSV